MEHVRYLDTFRAEVRSILGEGHERVPDDSIDALHDRFPRQSARAIANLLFFLYGPPPDSVVSQ